MNAKKVNYPVYQVSLSEEERADLINQIQAVNDGQGDIKDFPFLKKFFDVLVDFDTLNE